MKRITNMMIIMLFAIVFISFPLPVIHADSSTAGYIYEDLTVTVEVNDKREYNITEKMVIDFQKPMHGIIRDIPKISNVEKVYVRNIKVDGLSYEIENKSDSVHVKIGDSEETIEGRKEITLSYTLKHYQDYEESSDYIYINVLGTNYDTETQKFHAEITYPQEAKLQDYHVTSGREGNRFNHYVSESLAGNKLILDSKKVLPSKVGVTAQLKFEQGAFPNAPNYQYPYVINDNSIQVRVDEEQNFYVEQLLSCTVNDSKVVMRVPLLHEGWEDTRIEDLVVEGEGDIDVRSEDDQLFLTSGKGTRQYHISYKIHPNELLKAYMNFTLNAPDEDTMIDKLSLTLQMPYEPDVEISWMRPGDETKEDRYQLTLGTITKFSTNNAIQAGEEATLRISVKSDAFHRSVGNYSWLALLSSAALFFLILFLRLSIYRKDDLIIPVTFYPPQGINSAEAGYIVDNKLSDSDIASLIFYWADQGYLTFHRNGEDYSFEKLKNPDVHSPVYEQALFLHMFSCGKDCKVTRQDLKDNFYQDVHSARQAILSKYTKEQPLYQRSADHTRKMIRKICILPLLLYLLFSMYNTYQDTGRVFALAVALVPMTLASGYFLWYALEAKHQMRETVKRIAYGILSLVLLGAAIQFSKTPWNLQLAICLILYLLAMILAGGLRKETDACRELRASLLGFKDFITMVEKDKLEMMLEEDPEYYYHVLPYAQVLHVTKLWTDKFQDITMPPPAWYLDDEDFRYDRFLNSLCYIEQDMRDISSRNERTYTSNGSDSSHHNGYSGGGDGFSGGGSVGGGSGGGGSHGW